VGISADGSIADGDSFRNRWIVHRDICIAAGGTHEDWATYDRVVREERRTAVLVVPTRLYASPP
jgi:hypothetical protein